MSKSVRIEDPKMGHHLEWMPQECIEYYLRLRKLWQEGASRKPADFSEVFSLAKEANFKKVAFGTALFRLGVKEGISLNLSGNIPSGSGLGSSSALSLVIVKSIAEAYGKRISLEQMNEIALEIEQFAHGMPPGADNSTCCFGGLIWFQKDMRTGQSEIKSLKKEIPYELKDFILVQTGRPQKTTGELVQMVRMLDPKFRDPKVKRIGQIVREMREALRKKDFGSVKRLINEDWDLLKELGLSTPAADKLVEKIRSIGGAAKLCGACGGGTALCYHEDRTALKKAIKSVGFEPMEVELGVEGVRND